MTSITINRRKFDDVHIDGLGEDDDDGHFIADDLNLPTLCLRFKHSRQLLSINLNRTDLNRLLTILTSELADQLIDLCCTAEGCPRRRTFQLTTAHDKTEWSEYTEDHNLVPEPTRCYQHIPSGGLQ